LGSEPDACYTLSLGGIGMFAAMYENLLSEERLITRLANKMGVYGLLGRGEQFKNACGVADLALNPGSRMPMLVP
jgi:hypothetical protein